MKKTMLVLLVVLLLVPAGLFAGVFDLSIGPTAQYKIAYDFEGELDPEGMSDIENYAFGADIRARILFVELGVMGLYSQAAEDGYQVDGLLTGGLSFDLLSILRVGLGMGPRLSVNIDDEGTATVLGPRGEEIDGDTDFATAFMNAPMTYRATADIKLGNILVGLNYTVDSDGFTFDNQDVDKLNPDFENGRIGASVLFTLF